MNKCWLAWGSALPDCIAPRGVKSRQEPEFIPAHCRALVRHSRALSRRAVPRATGFANKQRVCRETVRKKGRAPAALQTAAVPQQRRLGVASSRVLLWLGLLSGWSEASSPGANCHAPAQLKGGCCNRVPACLGRPARSHVLRFFST